MSEKNDIFKDLFQKEFQDRREKVEEENWDLIAGRLEKKRFYKLSFSRFNIYYSLVTISLFLMSGFALFVWLKNQQYQDTNSFFGTKPSIESSGAGLTKTRDTLYPVENNINKTHPIQKTNDPVLGNNKNTEVKNTEIKKTGSPTSIGSNNESKKLTGPEDPKNLMKNNAPLVAGNKNNADKNADSTTTFAPKENSKPLIRKTIYVIKQDTLIKIDTIRESSNRKKTKK